MKKMKVFEHDKHEEREEKNEVKKNEVLVIHY
jgi:hypothetical protein